MKVYDIYTDGSHLDKLNNGRLGCGGVMVDRNNGGIGKLIDEFSQELTPEMLQREFGSSRCSNPTAELIGVLLALETFDIPSDSMITIHADYLGVKNWMEGTWKIKEPYIQEVANQIKEVIERKNLGGRIKYAWVKGHQSKSIMDPDAHWNNYVDILAKGQKEDE